MLLLLLLLSLLFAGGSSDTATLKFNLRTNTDCIAELGAPVITLWVETLGGDFDYLLTYNGMLHHCMILAVYDTIRARLCFIVIGLAA